MKQDKWTQQLHDKLADYQTDAPEGLWEDIEATLQAKAKPKRSRFVMLHRWAAAACLVSFLATGGYWWYQANVGSKEVGKPSVIAEVERKTEISQENPNPVEPILDEDRSHEECVSVKLAKKTGQIHPVLLSETDSNNDADAPQDTIQYLANEDAAQELPAEIPSARQEEQEVIRELDKAIFELSKSRKPSLSLDLYAMNGFGKQTNSNGVLMSDALLQKFTNANSQGYSARLKMPVYLAGYEERQKHHQPLSWGLSLRYPINKWFSITTGTVFTRLHSDFLYITPTQQIDKEQTLYYLGIPLQFNAQLWSYKGLKTYLSVGIQTDWNIGTSLKSNGITQKLDKDRMQWSVNSSVGMEYDIIPQLGLYVEPGLRHYFDNGSRIENFFKDKPTNFNLQIGVRWNLSK